MNLNNRHSTTVKRTVAILAVVALVLGGAAVGTSTATQQPALPVEVTTDYLGDSTEADHAFSLRITVSPDDRTLESTTVDIAAMTRAFISQRSISTFVSTQDGRQVLTRSSEAPGEFHVDRLRPGEEVTIELKLYPQALVPGGERLAQVTVESQFAANNRVVSNEFGVAPQLSEGDVTVVEDRRIPLVTAVGGGLASGALISTLIGVVLWKRKQSQLSRLLGRLDDAVMSAEAEDLVGQARTVVGDTDSGIDSGSVTDEDEDDDDDLFGVSNDSSTAPDDTDDFDISLGQD